MGDKAAERFMWAIGEMGIDPSDRLLEIGCGNGAMLSLICDKLDGGRITGIDRSKAMVVKAMERNRSHLATGKAEILAVSLHEAVWAGRTFSKIFAFNVNVFWLQPDRELEILKGLLAPESVLHLFYQPPAAGKIHGIAGQTSFHLAQNGYSVHGVTVGPLSPLPVVCIRASWIPEPKRGE